uniref:Uncharacterized protein n=1 Tax=Rhizophora mucronata TaxID=61149 RepID=A0A2P2IPS8_RHIMU
MHVNDMVRDNDVRLHACLQGQCMKGETLTNCLEFCALVQQVADAFCYHLIFEAKRFSISSRWRETAPHQQALPS